MIPWLREELAYRVAAGTPDLDAPVFPTRPATRFHRTKDNPNRNVVRPVLSAANDARRKRGMSPLPVVVAAHTFRRTYVTLMLEAGAPITYPQGQARRDRSTPRLTAQLARRSAPPSSRPLC